MPKLSDKPVIKIEDLYRFKLVSDPQISPDGTQVVFVVETMDKEDKAYYTHLYIVDRNGRRLRQLTFEKRNDHTPRWSPDGSTVAFIRKQETKSQIWILPLGTGGEAQPLTKLTRGTVTDLRWSPPGDRIAFLFHPLGKEVEVDDEGQPKTPVAREINDIFFRLDGTGFLDSEYTHVWVANAKTGTTKQLVDGPYNDTFPAWSPDGKTVAFISLREADWQVRLEEQHIYTVPSEGGHVKKIAGPIGPKEGLSYSPDGKLLAYYGHRRPYHSWGAVGNLLTTITIDGKSYTEYGKELDRTAYALTLGDLTPAFVVTEPVWSPDGKSIYYGITRDGRQPIMCANLNSKKVKPVTVNDSVAISWSVSDNGSHLIYHGASLASPDELYLLNLGSGKTRQITHLNRRYIRSRNFTVAEEVTFKNGTQELQGWIAKPPNFSRRKKYPFILNIHGGPRCQYGRTFFHEMYALAAAGYVVMYTNPRGSQGYGEAFADAITGKWAEPAMEDLLAAVDYIVDQGYVDPKRMGVTGGSYGGYMTNWIVTHTDRFAAAATQRCVSDLSSMFGNSDVSWDLAYEFGGAPWEKPGVYRKWSPITYIEQCQTPLLVIHSENDLRCNIEQGDQMYLSLKYLKQETEYVRFPEEFHGLSRHGRPDRREKRLQVLIDWFDRYLKK